MPSSYHFLNLLYNYYSIANKKIWEQPIHIVITTSFQHDSGHLFEAGHLLNFHHSQQVVSLFCNKTVNNSKT